METLYDIFTTYTVKGQKEYCNLDGYEILKVSKYNGELEYTYIDGSIFLKETPKRIFKLSVVVKKSYPLILLQL